VDLRRRTAAFAGRDGRLAYDEFFVAEQNARVVRDAEAYYRAMMDGPTESWNLRDRHMTSTLGDLLEFLGRDGRPARLVVWAHNSHLGDARATDMGEQGELNVGQLARERFGGDVVSVGFTTSIGTVAAASEWDGPVRRKSVRAPLPGSYEALFQASGQPRMLLPLRSNLDLAAAVRGPKLERAIGVIYRPDTERRSHYFHARLDAQFDYVIHIDETRAVDPLDRAESWQGDPVPETYPTGL